MTNKQKAIERYFKAIGAKKKPADQISFPAHLEEEDRHYNEYILPDGMGICVDCTGWPDIIDHYPSFKKWALERIAGEGYKLEIAMPYLFFINREIDGDIYITEEIKDNEITLAAVEAATKYWESKND